MIQVNVADPMIQLEPASALRTNQGTGKKNLCWAKELPAEFFRGFRLFYLFGGGLGGCLFFFFLAHRTRGRGGSRRDVLGTATTSLPLAQGLLHLTPAAEPDWEAERGVATRHSGKLSVFTQPGLIPWSDRGNVR